MTEEGTNPLTIEIMTYHYYSIKLPTKFPNRTPASDFWHGYLTAHRMLEENLKGMTEITKIGIHYVDRLLAVPLVKEELCFTPMQEQIDELLRLTKQFQEDPSTGNKFKLFDYSDTLHASHNHEEEKE